MKTFLKLSALCLFLTAITSCSSRTNQETMTRFHDDGRAKPIVAVVPVIDRTTDQYPWNLSEELTYALYNRIVKRNTLWIDSIAEIARFKNRVQINDPFQANELKWAKQAFHEHEFLVLTELVEHDIHPKPSQNRILDRLTPSCELEMCVRIKVIDLREEPKLILDEVIRQVHSIPKIKDQSEQLQDKWKQKTYAVSPLGFAHLSFSKEIVYRVEEYISIAKSR